MCYNNIIIYVFNVFGVNLDLVLYKNSVVFTDERGADHAMGYLTNCLMSITIKPSVSCLSSHKLFD